MKETSAGCGQVVFRKNAVMPFGMTALFEAYIYSVFRYFHVQNLYENLYI